MAVAAVGLLAGCIWKEGGVGHLDYGVEIPQHDPTIELTDLSYSPPGAVHPGDIVRFTATASRKTPAQSCYVRATIGSAQHPLAGTDGGILQLHLNDDSDYPDQHGGDGVFTGQLTIPYSVTPQAGIPFSAFLDWFDGYDSPEIAGPPLDIEEAEE